MGASEVIHPLNKLMKFCSYNLVIATLRGVHISLELLFLKFKDDQGEGKAENCALCPHVAHAPSYLSTTGSRPKPTEWKRKSLTQWPVCVSHPHLGSGHP